ncbi:hypothetical protein CITRIK5_20269 [Citricoccus sp. K5]|nr:hypothetical protein CITRIK5_20269 [Citricoccus sp. K5]
MAVGFLQDPGRFPRAARHRL